MVGREAVVVGVRDQWLDAVAHEGPCVVVEVCTDLGEGERDDTTDDQAKAERDLVSIGSGEPIESDDSNAHEQEVLRHEYDQGIHSITLRSGRSTAPVPRLGRALSRRLRASESVSSRKSRYP